LEQRSLRSDWRLGSFQDCVADIKKFILQADIQLNQIAVGTAYFHQIYLSLVRYVVRTPRLHWEGKLMKKKCFLMAMVLV
jgi:hypothetical protein